MELVCAVLNRCSRAEREDPAWESQPQKEKVTPEGLVALLEWHVGTPDSRGGHQQLAWSWTTSELLQY